MTDNNIYLHDFVLQDQSKSLSQLKKETIFGKEIRNTIPKYDRPKHIDKPKCIGIQEIKIQTSIVSPINLNEQINQRINNFFTTHQRDMNTEIEDDTILRENTNHFLYNRTEKVLGIKNGLYPTF